VVRIVLSALVALSVAWPGGLAAQRAAPREAAPGDADYATFLAALPTAGVDGTMRRRLVATPGADNVRAKTGSLTAVRGLSGYLVDGGEMLLFSLLMNGYDAPGSVAVALEDLLIEQVALYRRPVEPGWPRPRRVP
jgi:D-alanyl-D-alanine carboxypeptidase